MSLNKTFPVRIFSMSAKILTIQPKSLLCQLQEVKVLCGSNPLLGENYTACSNRQTVTTHRKEDESQKKSFRLSDIGVDIKDSKISVEQKEKATEIYRKCQDIFSRGPTDLGHTDLVHHEIKLTDDKPFKMPYRRISPNRRFVSILLKCNTPFIVPILVECSTCAQERRNFTSLYRF